MSEWVSVRLAAALHAALAAVAADVASAAAGAELALPAPMKVAVRCALAVLSSLWVCVFWNDDARPVAACVSFVRTSTHFFALRQASQL